MAKDHQPEGFTDLSLDYLLCRDLRHPWEPSDVVYDRKTKQYTRTVVCPRCKTKRVDVLDQFGYQVRGARYEYPDDFLIKGHGRIGSDDRASIRLLSLKGISRR